MGAEVDLCDDLSGDFTYEKPDDISCDVRDYTSRIETNTPLDFDRGIEPNSSSSTHEPVDVLQQFREINDVGSVRYWPKQPDASEGLTPASNAGAARSSPGAAPGEFSSITGGVVSSDRGKMLFKVTPRATRSASHSTAPSPCRLARAASYSSVRAAGPVLSTTTVGDRAAQSTPGSCRSYRIWLIIPRGRLRTWPTVWGRRLSWSTPSLQLLPRSNVNGWGRA